MNTSTAIGNILVDYSRLESYIFPNKWPIWPWCSVSHKQ